MRWHRALGVAAQIGVLLLFGTAPARAAFDEASARAVLAVMRMPFVANHGQADPRVAFHAATFTGTLFVTHQGELIYALPGWTLSERLAGGRARPVGQEPSAVGVSYFAGNDPARWRSQLPAYEAIGLGEVWPGITVALQAQGRSVEKIFTVRAGVPVSHIRVRVDGATALAVNANGALVARTGLGPIIFTPPVAYQEHDGVRRPVAVAYRLAGRAYGFTVGAYDRSKPLVIDPILQSSYFGGTGGDGASAMAVHPTTGDVYVTGYTQSTNFPHTLGGVLPARGGGDYDGFVARFNGSLTTFIQATYLGGSGDDIIRSLAIHPANGDVYVGGVTSSANFPAVGGGAQPAFVGAEDAFAARLGPSLTTLPQATYLGGAGVDSASSLAIHPATGDVYVAGFTVSTDFPKTAGGAQTTKVGGQDAFVARLNGTLTSHIQSTYLGGTLEDFADSLAIHPTTGDVYVAGNTKSTNFPGTAGGAQTTYGGGDHDGFVARLTSSLGSLTQATYLGGGQEELASSLAVHPMTGDVYVLGYTHSANFPGTAGGAQPALGGEGDVFVARLTGSLTSLVQATYYGGSADEFPIGDRGIAIHPHTGEVYVTGLTFSTNIPGTSGGVQPIAPNAFGHAFLARLTGSLTSLAQATYLGGNSQDSGYSLAIHAISGHVYVVGDTLSTNFPASAGGGQSTYGGNNDGFVSRLTHSLAAVDTLTLSVLVSRPTFAVGQTAKISVGILDPGVPGTADFYIGTMRPDGLIEFLTGSGIVVSPLGILHPIATGIPLSAPFAAPVPDVYTHQFTANDPHGTYTFFFAAISGGNLVGLALAPYSFP